MNYATLRVLIVDDFGLARERTRNSLLNLGFSIGNIDEASNGADALATLRRAVIQNRAYDLLISDWNMPEMTGVDLVRACRADAQLKPLKIMIVSSESEKGSIVEALRAGANDYAVKPVSEADLIAKVYLLLKKVA